MNHNLPVFSYRTGEATIPMPEVLEKLIKADAEAHYSQNQNKNKQLKQRKEGVESQRVRQVQAAVSAAAAAAIAGASELSDGNATSSGSEFPVALAPRLSSSLSSSSMLSFSKRSISRRRQHQTPGGEEEELLAGNSGQDAGEATPVVDLWQDLSTVQSSRTGDGSGGGGGGGCGQRQRGERGRLYTDELVLPHWAPEVAEIARQRVEEGDVFHAVAICEVVR